MAPLPNIRQERFVQGLFEGKSATQSYADAGYKLHQGNSSRLRWFDTIQDRLRQLQTEAAKSSQVTVQSLLNELEEARQRATNVDQLAAATQAIMGKAKISGLLVNRSEIKVSDDFAGLKTVSECAAKVLRDLSEDHPDAQFTDDDIAGMARLLTRHCEEMQEYANSCVARLVPAIASPMRNRRTPAEIEHKRIERERARRDGGNGRQRQ